MFEDFDGIGDYDAVNYIMMKNEQKLNDLRERARVIEKNTGIDPKSFYEFCKENPIKEHNLIANMSVGGTIGAVTGAIGARIIDKSTVNGLVIGGFAGGILGALIEDKNTDRQKHIKNYELYLNKLEKDNPRKPATETHQTGYTEKFGDKILSNRQKQLTSHGYNK